MSCRVSLWLPKTHGEKCWREDKTVKCLHNVNLENYSRPAISWASLVLAASNATYVYNLDQSIRVMVWNFWSMLDFFFFWPLCFSWNWQQVYLFIFLLFAAFVALRESIITFQYQMTFKSFSRNGDQQKRGDLWGLSKREYEILVLFYTSCFHTIYSALLL